MPQKVDGKGDDGDHFSCRFRSIWHESQTLLQLQRHQQHCRTCGQSWVSDVETLGYSFCREGHGSRGSSWLLVNIGLCFDFTLRSKFSWFFTRCAHFLKTHWFYWAAKISDPLSRFLDFFSHSLIRGISEEFESIFLERVFYDMHHGRRAPKKILQYLCTYYEYSVYFLDVQIGIWSRISLMIWPRARPRPWFSQCSNFLRVIVSISNVISWFAEVSSYIFFAFLLHPRSLCLHIEEAKGQWEGGVERDR